MRQTVASPQSHDVYSSHTATGGERAELWERVEFRVFGHLGTANNDIYTVDDLAPDHSSWSVIRNVREGSCRCP